MYMYKYTITDVFIKDLMFVDYLIKRFKKAPRTSEDKFT